MWTPLGPKNFTNIIGTLNPRADRVLALAAHYDSKILPVVNGKFFTAATDSAVPCAMLLDFARDLSEKAKEITAVCFFCVFPTRAVKLGMHQILKDIAM